MKMYFERKKNKYGRRNSIFRNKKNIYILRRKKDEKIYKGRKKNIYRKKNEHVWEEGRKCISKEEKHI